MDRRGTERADDSDGLRALLAAEERLAGLVAEREKEAADIIATAERDAHERLASLDAELEREALALAASIDAGSDKLAERLRQQAHTTAEHYRNISEDEIAELADFVVASIIRTPPRERR